MLLPLHSSSLLHVLRLRAPASGAPSHFPYPTARMHYTNSFVIVPLESMRPPFHLFHCFPPYPSPTPSRRLTMSCRATSWRYVSRCTTSTNLSPSHPTPQIHSHNNFCASLTALPPCSRYDRSIALARGLQRNYLVPKTCGFSQSGFPNPSLLLLQHTVVVRHTFLLPLCMEHSRQTRR